MSAVFLAHPKPKLLMLADTDRLDNELTIAQMQVRKQSRRSYVALVSKPYLCLLRGAFSSCSCAGQAMRCTRTRRKLPLPLLRRLFAAAR